MEEQAAVAEYSAALAAMQNPAAEEPVPEEPVPEEPEVAESPAAEEPVAEEATAEPEEPVEPEMTQREKSWEGRLAKREAELKAREEALAAKETEEAPEKDQETGTLDALLEEVASMDDGGFNAILQEANETYGGDFMKLVVGMASKIAAIQAKREADRVDGNLRDFSGAVQNEFRSAHIDRIAQDHPDYAEIVDAEGFKEWIGAMPDEERTKAETLLKSGRARPIAKLLTRYKEAMNKSDDVDDDTAVRGSAPVNIPRRPVMSDEEEYAVALKRMMKTG